MEIIKYHGMVTGRFSCKGINKSTIPRGEIMLHIELTKNEVETILPDLEACLVRDMDDPEAAPENAVKDFQSVIKKLKETSDGKRNITS